MRKYLDFIWGGREQAEARHKAPHDVLEYHTETYDLAITTEFLNFVLEHFDDIQDAQTLALKLKDLINDPRHVSAIGERSQGGITISPIKTAGYSKAFNVELAGQNFFLKFAERESRSPIVAGGAKEFADTMGAAEDPVVEAILAKYKAQINKPLLGYSDASINYFVTRSVNLKPLDALGASFPTLKATNEFSRRWLALSQELEKQGYDDIKPWNMFYDNTTDTIVLFDISKKTKR